MLLKHLRFNLSVITAYHFWPRFTAAAQMDARSIMLANYGR
jgi:hypothetical protein